MSVPMGAIIGRSSGWRRAKPVDRPFMQSGESGADHQPQDGRFNRWARRFEQRFALELKPL